MDFGVTYAGYDILCMIIMAIITSMTLQMKGKLKHQRTYLALMTFALFLVLGDFVYNLAMGGILPIGIPGMYVANSVYFISSMMIAYMWVLYIARYLKISELERIWVKAIIFFPAEAVSFMSIVSFRTGWIFTLAEDGTYYRGPLNWISMLVPAVYFILAIVLAIINYVKHKSPENKEIVKDGFAFASFPGVALSIQYFLVGFPAICIGALLGMLYVFLHNIVSEREQLFAEQKVAEAKSEFFASMSHEIRTPINAVLGMNTMIMRETTEPQIAGYAQIIENSGKMLLSTINDILDFSKAESGKLELVYAEYGTADVIRDLILMIKTKAEDKGLHFNLDIEKIIPSRLYGDEVRIKQIIINLLTNAVKYTSRGSVTLHISYRNVSEGNIKLCVAVEDTGKGIKPEAINELFSPYVRFNEQENRNIEGTGLGLSIVRMLLKLMDSELKVESEYGKGSIFSFEVSQGVRDRTPIGPVEQILEKPKQQATVTRESFVAPDVKILSVDDTVVNLTVFKQLLKNTKVQIDTATSGMEALVKVRQNQYDMIFLDHMMPGMDGIETLERIREDKLVSEETPIIIFTANVVSGYREMFMEAGFTDFLPKPVEIRELESMMVKYLPEDKVRIL